MEEKKLYNNENLTKSNFANLSKEERIENARKGGIASGEAKRKRKTLKEHILKELEKGNRQELIIKALLDKAELGDVKAFESVRDTIGEKQADKIDANVTTYESKLKELNGEEF